MGSGLFMCAGKSANPGAPAFNRMTVEISIVSPDSRILRIPAWPIAMQIIALNQYLKFHFQDRQSPMQDWKLRLQQRMHCPARPYIQVH